MRRRDLYARCPARGDIAELKGKVFNGLSTNVKTALFLARLNIGVTVSLVAAVIGAAYYLVQKLMLTNEVLVDRLNAAILTIQTGIRP